MVSELKCMYSYYNTLLDIWSSWNDSVLYGIMPEGASNFTEALGINTSDGRSRAKEMFRIGLLKMELTKGQTALDAIREQVNVQSNLGYVSAILAKAANIKRTESIDKALSALCALFSLMQSLKVDAHEISINTLIFKLGELFPCPSNVDFRTWFRYVLSAFLCELNYREEVHRNNFEESNKDSQYFSNLLFSNASHISLTIRTNKQNGYQARKTISTSDDVMSAIKDRVSLTNIIQQKSPLFIFGDERSSNPAGFYSMANKYFNHFLELCYQIEIRNISNSPFKPFYDERTSASAKPFILERLPFIFNNQSEEVKKEYTALMKSIYEGAKDALGILDYTPIEKSESNTTTCDYKYYLSAIRTKPFILLAGISGTGKSQIVRKLAQASVPLNSSEEEKRFDNPRPRNFELIQVKPNWHSSMDVVGYVSNIPSPHYVFTPFIEFVAKAWQDLSTPYFLCLDEMNLAPVEEYFAEFLSAIESRTKSKWKKLNGEEQEVYETDPIISVIKEPEQGESDEISESLRNDMIEHLLGKSAPGDNKRELEMWFKKKGLTLPPNLIIMGTVNMDETTFSFSRKVLDRAMSIEMNEVDFMKFLDGSSEQIVPTLSAKEIELLVNRPIKAGDVKDHLGNISTKIINYLIDINKLLEGTPFKLGYRSANEAMLYVSSSMDFGNDDMAKALDEFSLMKILSRIEGDETKLSIDAGEDKITAIGGLAQTADRHGQTTILSILKAIMVKHFGDVEKSESVKKLDEMIEVLHREHFVSYWG